MRMVDGRPLSLQLLAAGRRASISAEGGKIRFWSICLSTFIFILAIFSLMLASATYEGRDIRGAARSPLPVRQDGTHSAVALWSPDTDDIDGSQFFLAYIEPLSDNAPPPPGLVKWPQPGEAVLSEALVMAGADDGIKSRYGRFAGFISSDGLQSPSERFAYVRPARTMLDSRDMYKISGFGRPSEIYWGESRSLPNFTMFSAGVVGFLLLPASALLISSVRTGSSARERRVALLELLGAGLRSRIIFVIGESITPVAVGCLASIAAVTPALKWNVPFPGVEFVLYSADATRSLPKLVGAFAISVIVILFAAVVLTPGTRKSRYFHIGTRVYKHTRWWPWIFPLSFILAVRGPGLASTEWRLPIYVIGTLGTLTALPSLVSLAVAQGGSILSAAGTRAGSSGMIFSGRRTALQSRSTARFVTALMVAIFLVVQTQLWTGLLGANAKLARDSQDRIGTSLVTVSAASTASKVRDFSSSLPRDVEIAAINMSAPNGSGLRSLSISGSCAALRGLAAPCKRAEVPPRSIDQRVSELIRWNSSGAPTVGRIEIRPNPVYRLDVDHTENSSLFLFSKSGKNLPVSSLRMIARSTLAMRAKVEPLGNSWELGARDLVSSAKWVRLLGAIGMMFTLFAVGISFLGEFLRFGREVAPLIILTGNVRVYASIVFWSMFVPSLLASLGGALASSWLTSPITAGYGNPVSGALYLSVTAAAITASAFLCLCGWRIMTRMALSWRSQEEVC